MDQDVQSPNRYFESLQRASDFYLGWGWSVIPLYGDARPLYAKAAAVPWSRYQWYRPSVETCERWFIRERWPALGIVTGRVSGLMVLDFDDAMLAYDFERRFPHLVDKTRVVLSANRKLPHYYFVLPPYLSCRSRRLQGLDVQYDGRYIVAPPSVIDGKTYDIQRGGMPYVLSQPELRDINHFIKQHCLASDEPFHEDVVDRSPTGDLWVTTPAALASRYRQLAPRIGRNEALFRVGLQARDSGMTFFQAMAELADLHIQEPAHHPHASETAEKRLREAAGTLASVYKRPPRRPPLPKQPGLPTSIREALVRNGQTAVARVLDGLFLRGVQPGDRLTERKISEILRGVIGRFSILSAIKARFADSEPIFAQSDLPSPTPPTPTEVAEYSEQAQNKKCFLFGPTKPNKIRRGRPPIVYVVPSFSELCEHLGVPYTRTDPLTTQDIGSVRRYRAAIDREFLRRKPGEYSRAWLAQRLNISVRTSQRYHAASSVICRLPIYNQTPLIAEHVDQLLPPDDERLPDAFLMDEQGRKYPPLRALAKRLLRRRSMILYVRQGCNRYWIADLSRMSMKELLSRDGNASISHEKACRSDFEGLKVKPYMTFEKDALESLKRSFSQVRSQAPRAAQTLSEPPKTLLSEAPSEAQGQQAQEKLAKPPRKTKRYYKRPLPSVRLEWLANKLYETLKQVSAHLGHESQGYASLPNARRWVEEYGIRLVRRLIYVLQERNNLRNPAGFALVWLRDAARRTL
ncbi:MAG: bifunctional DNA primase/polymerase [Anaerolineae bacterium]|nr:bifunctional DNA primase/polymerase [Anaerolineae bacterium]MDW8170906.1 bifunctional DNA primase/polymerase [Anaerolineae bacterium]